jgi:hypothetical protein
MAIGTLLADVELRTRKEVQHAPRGRAMGCWQ